jgi:hypothetical protein
MLVIAVARGPDVGHMRLVPDGKVAVLHCCTTSQLLNSGARQRALARSPAPDFSILSPCGLHHASIEPVKHPLRTGI